jgi:hypothetical protein
VLSLHSGGDTGNQSGPPRLRPCAGVDVVCSSSSAMRPQVALLVLPGVSWVLMFVLGCVALCVLQRAAGPAACVSAFFRQNRTSPGALTLTLCFLPPECLTQQPCELQGVCVCAVFLEALVMHASVPIGTNSEWVDECCIVSQHSNWTGKGTALHWPALFDTMHAVLSQHATHRHAHACLFCSRQMPLPLVLFVWAACCTAHSMHAAAA